MKINGYLIVCSFGVAMVSMAPANGQMPSPQSSYLNQLGRFFGVGMSEGYHQCPTCEPRHPVLHQVTQRLTPGSYDHRGPLAHSMFADRPVGMLAPNPPLNAHIVGGPMVNAPITNGPITNGVIPNGVIPNGVIHNGPIHNGPTHNGPAHNNNVPVHNGPVHNGPIHNVPVHNGPVHNGPIHNGLDSHRANSIGSGSSAPNISNPPHVPAPTPQAQPQPTSPKSVLEPKRPEPTPAVSPSDILPF